MTAEELKQLKAAFVMTAAYYRDQIDDALIKMYAADLSDLPIDRVLPAFESYRRDPRNRRTPLPADIRHLVAPPENDEDVARDAAARIIAAVGKRGFYWGLGYYQGGKTCFDGGSKTFPAFEVALQEELGPAGARVVQKMGGWQRAYEFVCESSTTTVNAQLRDLALSSIRRARAGTEAPLSLQRGGERAQPLIDAPVAKSEGLSPISGLVKALVPPSRIDTNEPGK